VKLRYAIGGIAAAALLALPAGAAAAQGGQVNSLAAQQCSQEKADLGKKAFRKRYGAKRTMQACAKRTRPQVAAALNAGNADCQAELAQSGLTEFIEDYGEDATDTLDNAMAECIAEDADEILNPGDYEDGEEEDD
jgi:spermidine/putrescine-binding protein